MESKTGQDEPIWRDGKRHAMCSFPKLPARHALTALRRQLATTCPTRHVRSRSPAAPGMPLRCNIWPLTITSTTIVTTLPAHNGMLRVHTPTAHRQHRDAPTLQHLVPLGRDAAVARLNDGAALHLLGHLDKVGVQRPPSGLAVRSSLPTVAAPR